MFLSEAPSLYILSTEYQVSIFSCPLLFGPVSKHQVSIFLCPLLYGPVRPDLKYFCFVGLSPVRKAISNVERRQFQAVLFSYCTHTRQYRARTKVILLSPCTNPCWCLCVRDTQQANGILRRGSTRNQTPAQQTSSSSDIVMHCEFPCLMRHVFRPRTSTPIWLATHTSRLSKIGRGADREPRCHMQTFREKPAPAAEHHPWVEEPRD